LSAQQKIQEQERLNYAKLESEVSKHVTDPSTVLIERWVPALLLFMEYDNENAPSTV